MFLRKTLDKNVHVINAIKHSAMWPTALFLDNEIPNPHFDNDDDSVAIVCIHGTADTSAAFQVIARRLLPTLNKKVSLIDLISFEKRTFAKLKPHRHDYGSGIEGYAKQLCEQIILKKYKRIFILAHSRGGLVGAKFVETYAKKMGIDILGIVSICSPMGGSDLASDKVKFIEETIAEMTPGSTFLIELNESIANSIYDYHFVAVEYDYIVKASAAFVSKNCQSLVYFDRHGHLSILHSNRLVSYLSKCIDAAIEKHAKKPIPKLTDIILHASDEKTEVKLSDIFFEVHAQINTIRKEKYFGGIREYFPDSELEDLKELRSVVVAMLYEPRHEAYSKARTIGDLITTFMAIRKQAELSSWFMPTKLFSTFFTPARNPDTFLMDLKSKYDTFLLPGVTEAPEDQQGMTMSLMK